jgi:CDP-diacylglycerol--glycerol-3-phosphate 3-phosphatidyltransferase
LILRPRRGAARRGARRRRAGNEIRDRLRHNRPMFLTIPTLLTWARIAAIPLIVGVYYLPWDMATKNVAATAMFVLFALTDWLDGWLARRLDQTSAFGAFLDPVADKILICASLLVLLEHGRVDALVALVIIGREIAISALREWMAQIGASRSVAVHMLGKLKTVSQMIAIPFLLYDARLFGFVDTRLWGSWLIYIAALLTIWSMVYYLRKAIPEIRAKAR